MDAPDTSERAWFVSANAFTVAETLRRRSNPHWGYAADGHGCCLEGEIPMRRALLLLLLLLSLSLSGCTIVPITYAGPCSGVTNARGCQEDPYVVRWGSEDSTPSGESQKTTR
jgi:hypothetical protein